jgi:hypothetical protein
MILTLPPGIMPVAVSYSKHASKSRQDLAEEVIRLERELKSRDLEIATLQKKLRLYKNL